MRNSLYFCRIRYVILQNNWKYHPRISHLELKWLGIFLPLKKGGKIKCIFSLVSNVVTSTNTMKHGQMLLTFCIYISMTTLLTLFRPDLVTWRSYKGWFRPWLVGIGLTHTVAHSTKPSFMPKTNNQPAKKFLSLALSWASYQKWQNSDYQSQFSMSNIIGIIPTFFIEEFEIRSTTFINDTFCSMSFLKHFIN